MDGDNHLTGNHSTVTKTLGHIKGHPWIALTAVVLVMGLAAFVVIPQHTNNSISVAQSSTKTTSATDAGAANVRASSLSAASATVVKTNTASATRMVIEQASLGETVPNVHPAADKIEQMTVGDGGFVQSLTESGTSSGSMMNLIVRVPETDFETFLSGARGIGTVTNFSQTGQDVTQQYQGLQNSLAELESESAAYTRLYNKAQSMQDMLQIQDSLSQVDSQIADLQAQQHNLSRSVQLATVNLTLTTTQTAVVSRNRSPVVHALYQSIKALRSSLLALMTFVAWLLPWGVLVAGVWGAIRLWRTKKSKM